MHHKTCYVCYIYTKIIIIFSPHFKECKNTDLVAVTFLLSMIEIQWTNRNIIIQFTTELKPIVSVVSNNTYTQILQGDFVYIT